MNTIKKILTGLTVLAILLTAYTLKAEEKADFRCKKLEIQSIPVGDFTPPRLNPYNNRFEESQEFNSEEELSGFNSEWWGHSGYDMQGLPKERGNYHGREMTLPNNHAIHSMLDGKVIVSAKESETGGWGESVVIATRLNQYSEEILTHHYHHLHADYDGGKYGNEYYTTREVGECDTVERGQKIGMEGTTGFSNGAHLHFGLRRWANIQQLNDALNRNLQTVFGSGYVFNNASQLNTNLNPKTFLNNTFLDYDFEKKKKEWPWYWRTILFADAMRSHGIELGKWDGKFGAEDLVKRREAARWIKIAAKQPSLNQSIQLFTDVATDDPDYPYIEALTAYPAIKPTIDKGKNGQMKAFEPDRYLCRSEALKMIITAFYLPEYLEYYQKNFWMKNAEEVLTTLLPYKDLHPLSWYASYAVFAIEKKIIYFGEELNACYQLNRAQFAFMLVRSARDLDNYVKRNNGKREYIFCGPDQFLHPTEDRCEKLPTCIPTEENPCSIGGGLQEEENLNDNTTPNTQPQNQPERECTAEQMQQIQCNKNGQLGIQRRGCANNQTWGEWSNCMIPDDPDELNHEGTCGNCGCTPGNTRIYNCWLNGREGQKVQTCTPEGYWGLFTSCQTGGDPNQPNNPPNQQENPPNQQDTNNPPNQTQHPDSPQSPEQCECTTGPCCDGCNFSSTQSACESWYTYRCPDNNNGSNAQKALVRQYCPGNINQCTGEIKQFSWMTHEDCSTSQKCTMRGDTSTCEGSCRDTYSANRKEACYRNKYSAGSPTLCLGIRQQDDPYDRSKAKWQYRVCKEGGAFQNNFKMRLRDDNHDVVFPQRTNSKGMTCSPWINFDTNYIDKYGTTNGAGLKADVWSPSNCTSSSCHYTTGTVTISLACR